MRLIRLLLLVVSLSAVVINGQSGWTPLWNGTDLDGWTTWMRQPEAGSDVLGLKKDAAGKYTEPIGPFRPSLR